MAFSNSRRRAGSSGKSAVAGGVTLMSESSCCGAGVCADMGGDRNELRTAIRMTESVFRIVAITSLSFVFRGLMTATERLWRLQSSFSSPVRFCFPEPVSVRGQFPPSRHHIFSAQDRSEPEPDESPAASDLIARPVGWRRSGAATGRNRAAGGSPRENARQPADDLHAVVR